MNSDIRNPTRRAGDRLPWYSPRSWVLRLLVPLLLVVAFVGWIYWNTSSAPREADRVRHPAGYSIVKPRRWTANVQLNPTERERDGISLAPEKWISLEPKIWANRLLWPPDIQKLLDSGYVEGDFQGRRAWLNQQKLKRGIVRTVVFRDGDDWYQIGVNLPGLEGASVEEWWQYPLTFRPAPPHPATSRPATGAVDQS